LDRIRELADARIVLLTDFPRGDVAGNFARALSHCRGTHIFLADQDDIWLPNKVQTCLAALEHCQLVLHDAHIMDAQGQILARSMFAERQAKPGFWRNLLRNSYMGCCMAFQREFLAQALPFPANLPMHDWWLGLLAEKKGAVRWIREPLLLHRRHAHNANFGVGQSPYSLRKRVGFRVFLLRRV
jgi:hypothetical protein